MKRTTTLFLLATLAGGFAGIIASVFTNQSLDEYARQISEGQALFQISEVRPRPLPGTYEEALSRVQEAGWSSIAHLRAQTEDSNTVNEWITEGSFEAIGAVVTNDGWILFHEAAVEPYIDDITQMEIWVEGDRYLVEELFEDSQSDFVFVRVNASDLPVLAFGASSQMQGGDLLFGITGLGSVDPTSLQDSRVLRGEVADTVEFFDYQWSVESVSEVQTPLLNSNGELVGFTTEFGLATPIHHVQPFVESVLRDQRVIHTGVGAHTASLDTVLNIDKEALGVSIGELVVSPELGTPAIIPGGPADLAGIEEGDIILAVDDVLLTERDYLADMIATYEVGNRAEILLLRDGERQTVTIEFTELVNLY